MSNRKIVVTRAWPKDAEDHLVAQGLGDVTLRHPDTPMSADEFMTAAETCDVIMPTVSDKIPAEFYPAAKGRVKIMANYGVGFNHIDIEAARANDIAVTNTPDVLTDCTADLAMGLMLTAARRIGEGERETRAGNWAGWRPTHMIGKKVTGATLGIIGFGRIGQAMARRAHNGFGMRVVFQDAWSVPDDIKIQNGNAEQLGSMAEVAAQADFLSLHMPGGADTYKMINADVFDALKPGAILVNSARGDVVDEDALFAALDAGQLSAAGLDVFHNEPALDPRFMDYDNIVLAPHLGSATDGTRVGMGYRAIDNLVAYLNGETPGDLVT
ncbi:MAG: D-glycerate dehydrogenase [Pseudomonadota bacterium]